MIRVSLMLSRLPGVPRLGHPVNNEDCHIGLLGVVLSVVAIVFTNILMRPYGIAMIARLVG
jgi:hypothetical protein